MMRPMDSMPQDSGLSLGSAKTLGHHRVLALATQEGSASIPRPPGPPLTSAPSARLRSESNTWKWRSTAGWETSR